MKPVSPGQIQPAPQSDVTRRSPGASLERTGILPMLLSEAWTVQAEHCLQFSQEGPALAPETPTRDFEHAVKGPHSL